MYSNVAVTFDENHRWDDAIRYARRSIETARGIKGSGAQQSLAYGILADALRQAGDMEGGLAAVRESRRLQEQEPNTGKTWRRANLALALWREGSILGEDGDINLDRPREAVAVLRRAFQLADEVAAEDSDDTTHHQLTAEVARRLGEILRHSDAQSAAYDKGIARVLETRHANVATRRTRAGLLAGSSYALRSLHRVAEARSRIDSALQILRETGDYPADRIEPGSETELSLLALADQYAAAGQPTKAVETYQALLSRLKAWNPEPASALRSTTCLSSVYAGIARTLRMAGRLKEAAFYIAEHRSLWQVWDRKLPNNNFVQRQLASVRAN